MQDERIVALYWQRDESAISETERKYGRYLSKIAYNILSDWEDSKETVNDTYLKAWNSMPTHKPGVLSTYLGKITRQLSIDAFRTRNRDKRKHSEYAVSLSELEDCISGSETTEQSVELKLLAEAINTSAVLYHVTGKEKYAKDYAAFMKYLDEVVMDHENGSWFHQLDEQNHLKGTVWPGKSDLYHALQSTLIPYHKADTSIAPAVKKKLEI